ncbi:proteasome regulatory subunit C-terminal-domain-containing protein [Tuber borchii]|uniref:Proteasome regulatory subunit C-terminal-domain-containing protein n=1 Tax=Tuber borchii TaxID=42251 RepID=A0A2T6ZLV1_TUBBO|nr:proteasome regulatory subunit C-terminal-domain-containing protein [Tuber borchii]
MVDKSSLRSNKRSDSGSSGNKKNGDSSKQPAKSSAKKATTSKKAGSSSSSKEEILPVENGAEDIEMKDDAGATTPTAGKKTERSEKPGDEDADMNDGKEEGDKKEEDPVVTAINEIKENFTLLERAVTLFDARFTLRVLRSLSSLRRRLNPEILSKIVAETYPGDHPSSRRLTTAIGSSATGMELDSPSEGPKDGGALLPEIDIYLHLLVQIYLLDQKNLEMGASFSTELVQIIHSLNRRTLDSLAAKVYFYYSRVHELLPPPAITEIRPQLLASLRTATLRKDIDTQATLITLLLRNYLLTSHITQADHLVSKTLFPESAANNLIARYQYYLGRIRAIQLDYTAAHNELVGAIRKAPQTAAAAGFVQAANKLNIIVELLMGDIPERSIFREPRLEKSLHAYFLLVQAVRIGELDSFFDTLNTHAETFKKDGTYSLILRLRQNVIKTGIRMMSLSYSKISLRDICVRLRLDSEESAEYIVAKAIRDGVIEATLNHEKGYMQSKELLDVYATQEPQEAFHERIMFCMSLHNDSVKAMRFPMNQHRLELKNAQEARERERELAKEIQDGDIDDDDAGGEFEGM